MLWIYALYYRFSTEEKGTAPPIARQLEVAAVQEAVGGVPRHPVVQRAVLNRAVARRPGPLALSSPSFTGARAKAGYRAWKRLSVAPFLYYLYFTRA
jgi:hypothetical protein